MHAKPVPRDVAAKRDRPVDRIAKGIDRWQVVGADRLVGELHVDGEPTGRRVMTSSVVRVLLRGDPAVPFAVTCSGSVYRLGSPLAKHAEGAEQFLARMKGVRLPPTQADGSSTEYLPLQ